MPTPRTLLVADDSPTVRKVVSLTFDDEGFRVVTAASGAEALAEAGREVPDVILADVHMPAPGGYELCARLKNDERTRRVPVVLLVGAFEPFDEAEARSCGADGVLTKPFQSIRDLVSKVGGLLGGQHEPARDDNAAALGLTRDDARATRDATANSNVDLRTATADEPRASSQGVAASGEGDAQVAARPYSDFDMDDADIESVPAEEFDARRPAPDAATAAAAADLFAAGFAGAGEFAPAFADADTSTEAEPNPSAVVSHQPPADARQASAPAQSRADASDEPSMIEQGEYQVSEPTVSVVSAFDEPTMSQPHETSAAAQRSLPARDAEIDRRAQASDADPHGFDARADAAAAADDTLLELGDIDSPPSRAVAADDDFVLDFDDEPRAFTSHAAEPGDEPAYAVSSFDDSSYRDQSASASAREQPSYAESPSGGSSYYEQPYAEPSYGEASYGESSYDEPMLSEGAPSAVEMQSAGSVSMAEPSAVWDAAQEFTASPDAVTEPVVTPVWEEPEVSATDSVDVQTVSDAGDVRATTDSAHDAGAQPASQAGAQLSPEAVEAIARRVVELLSDRAVREIAWEVVPDLAERLIKQKLEEERAR